MLNCIIIDDEEHNIETLRIYAQRVPFLNLVFDTTNPIEGLTYIQEHDPDLVFLDIQMDGLSGMDLVKMLKEKHKVVFTTAASGYSVDAFGEGVLDYLLKPIEFDRFLKAAQRANENKKKADSPPPPPPQPVEDDIYIKGDNKGKMTRVRLDDICYVQGMGNYVGVYTKNGSRMMTLLTFRDLEERLPYPRFIRVHKSYMVAYDCISGIDGNELILKVDKKELNIPIGGIYRERFLTLIQGR